MNCVSYQMKHPSLCISIQYWSVSGLDETLGNRNEPIMTIQPKKFIYILNILKQMLY